jgi:DNA repair protein RecN (Recombination protein N)
VLLELRVQNLLLIESAELRLGPGLTVITGETGAGKTILAHSLDLLMGGKPRAGIVRPGADEAYVEGVFEAPPGLLDHDDLADLRERVPDGEEIVLGRRVGADGRSRAFVQGRSASAADLRELGRRLVSFYGQHEHRKLTVASAQLQVLDGFCGNAHAADLASLAAAHARVLELRRELAALSEADGARERDRDLLAFELEEIESLEPAIEERESLAAERGRLHGLDRLRAAAGAGAEALAPDSPERLGIAAQLAESEREARGAEDLDPELAALAARLETLRLEAEDLGAELRRYLEGLGADPGRLEEVEERLDRYERLERKHGGTVEKVLEHAAHCRSRLDQLENRDEALERIQGDLARAERESDEAAGRVSAARAKAAPKLAKRVRAELAELALEDAAFEVRLEPREERAASGDERAEFLLAPNPGVPSSPLRETASGGELSRSMLAIMGVAAGGGPGTLVFDEVDAGIGGKTARSVGERLKALAAERQILCITHLPQIASLGDSHFRIAKEARGELALTTVERLGAKEIEAELVRMLGADGGDTSAIKHARSLLKAA